MKVLFIIAGLIPFLFTKPATAQVMTAVPQTVAVPAATQTTTDEDTQKRIEKFIAQLGDKQYSVRVSAANALGKIGDPQAVQALIKALSDRDLRVRQSAADALVKIGRPAVQSLIKALREKEPIARSFAANALVKIGQPAVQPLIEALSDRNFSVRGLAAGALGKIGDPQAVQNLIKALGDSSSFVRVSAAGALGEIGDPQAIQPLIKALSDRNDGVRRYAADALGRIGQLTQAYHPFPADGSLHRDTWVNISWKPGDKAVSHDVYFSDNSNLVDDGAAEAFQGNQAGTFIVVGFPGFPYPDGLVPGTTYYWRIDEVNDNEPNSPWIGPVWSFSIPPRTAARKAREVLFVLVKLLTPCLPIFLFVGLGLVLKYKGYITTNVAKAISIYPTLVIGNAICPLKFTILGLAYSSFGLWTLGGRWLSITTGGFLVLVYEYDLGAPYGHKEMYYSLSLAYFAVFFLPLFGYLFFKKRNAKITCALVQFVFIICHAAVIYVLITRYDLVHRMIDVLRF